MAPGKQPNRSKARSLLCYWAVRELGMSCTVIAERLGMTQLGVSRAVQRGERLAKVTILNLSRTKREYYNFMTVPIFLAR